MFVAMKRTLVGLACALCLAGAVQAEDVPAGAVFSKPVEKAGVKFEAWVAPQRLAVPPRNADGVPILTLGIRVTNLAKRPLRFSQWFDFGLLPVLTGPDGKPLAVLQPATDMILPTPTGADYPTVSPGGSLAYTVSSKFRWQEGALRLGGDGLRSSRLLAGWRRGGEWSISGLRRGRYMLQFRYSVQTPPRDVYDPVTKGRSALSDVWTGDITTPPVAFTLVMP